MPLLLITVATQYSKATRGLFRAGNQAGNRPINSTLVAAKVYMLYLCINSNSYCFIFYDSELHILFICAKGYGLRH
jgi:hypothetical protein